MRLHNDRSNAPQKPPHAKERDQVIRGTYVSPHRNFVMNACESSVRHYLVETGRADCVNVITVRAQYSDLPAEKTGKRLGRRSNERHTHRLRLHWIKSR